LFYKLWHNRFLEYSRVYAQTHVFKISVCKGSQSVLFVAIHPYGYRDLIKIRKSRIPLDILLAERREPYK
jgi:hypothetical protein